ncbi:MAG: glucose-1-phosphate adenylyltransferase [Gammaproteobacteria bacterium]|nr:glucose-1-phosphate adenylyltransferase [Gammaproteobacteria bacterium]
MERVVALILVGGQGKRLESLTKKTSKPYVSFLGKYRIIDFPLSALSHSYIYNVGIITQYEPYDLMEYIGNGSTYDLDHFNRGVSFLTPYMKEKGVIDVQKGTADAVRMQVDFLKKTPAKYVLILSGDQIYKINFRDVLKKHIESNAELTILTKKLDNKKELSRFGIIEYDENNKIISFEEKPKKPKSDNISMGIYLFNKDYLLKYIKLADKMTDFGNDLIPYLLENTKNVYAYPYDGIFFDVGTISSLYNANMYFIDNPLQISPHQDNLRVYSKPYDYYPHVIGKNATVNTSFISDGSVVEGKVTHSVLSYKCIIKEKAKVEDSVIMPNVTVEEGVRIKNAIVKENLVVKKGSKLIFDKPTLVDEKYEEVSHD